MEIGVLLKMAAVGILTAVVCQVLSKAGRDDIAGVVALAAFVCVLLMALEGVGTLLSFVRSVFGV